MCRESNVRKRPTHLTPSAPSRCLPRGCWRFSQIISGARIFAWRKQFLIIADVYHNRWPIVAVATWSFWQLVCAGRSFAVRTIACAETASFIGFRPPRALFQQPFNPSRNWLIQCPDRPWPGEPSIPSATSACKCICWVFMRLPKLSLARN